MTAHRSKLLRVVQVSDTHLSTRHRHFAANAEAMRAWLVAQQPDLIINTGDLAMDGAGNAADLDAAAAWHRGLPAPVHSVPGNHDVGDTAALRLDQPVNDARLAAWRERFGLDRWVLDLSGWRMIGLNAMLLGTGHAEEEAQFAWLAEVVAHNGPLALFLHKPLFVNYPDEGPRGYWTVVPEPRRRLLDVMSGRDVALIASGHLHTLRQRRYGRTHHVWAPSAAFVVGEDQEELGGTRRLGAIVHEFTATEVASQFVRPDGLEDLPIDPVLREIYPRPVAVSA